MASTPIPHILFVLLPHRSECCLPFIAAAGKVTFLTQLNPEQLFIVQMLNYSAVEIRYTIEYHNIRINAAL